MASDPNTLEPDNTLQPDALEPGILSDETSLDGDSGFGDSDSDQTDTDSIASAIKQYREENGRTYHSYGVQTYYGPNDEEAQDHHDVSHQFHTVLLGGKLVHAPIGNVNRVLDLGTGTGIWVMDFADAHPEANVKGIDLSPIQPIFVPPNARFEIDDFNLEFYDDDKFDLIHQRELNGCIKDLPLFYRRCFAALAPGGWLDVTEWEIVDYFSTSNEDKPLSSLTSKNHPLHGNVADFILGCERLGVDGNIAPKIEGHLKDSGFENIKVEKRKAPVGRWAKGKRQKEIGAWNLLRLQTGLVGYYMRIGTSQLGWTRDEVHVYVAAIRAAYRELHWQLYLNVYLISAQRPLESPDPSAANSPQNPQSPQSPTAQQ